MRRTGPGPKVAVLPADGLRWRRRQRSRGATLVEFALVAPIGFLLICSIVVAGVVVTNYIQLTNAARDGARIAAICGSTGSVIPDGSGNTCSAQNVSVYITNHLSSIPAGMVTPTISLCSADGTGCSSVSGNALLQCQGDRLLEVDVTYPQPLYLPLVSALFQGASSGTVTLQAQAQATCEQ